MKNFLKVKAEGTEHHVEFLLEIKGPISWSGPNSALVSVADRLLRVPREAIVEIKAEYAA